MLTIQKIVKLLDDFHYAQFHEYVKTRSIRSFYPLSLIDVISREIEIVQGSDELCKKVYGDLEEKTKKKFFQLTHYTFRLTSFLAKNYPNYLSHNLTKIQHHLNCGRLDKALELAEILLDIVQKVEDEHTEVRLLQILVQTEVLLESNKSVSEYEKRINLLLENERTLNNINTFLHRNFMIKGKPKEANAKESIAFFIPFLKYPSTVIRLTARFHYCFALYYFKIPDFYTEKQYKELIAIENSLQKYDYVIFPFLSDFSHRIPYLKLHHSITKLGQEEILREAQHIIEYSENNLFWKSFYNIPQMFSIAVQSSLYVSTYLNAYKTDMSNNLPPAVETSVAKLKSQCEELLENRFVEEKTTIRYINISCIYTGLLLLGPKEDILKATRILENVLLTYQQIPFHAYIDPVFTILMQGYFCLRNHEKIDESYKRYRKSTKGKVVNPQNDLTIHVVYYLSKWLETNRKQYAVKLSKAITTAKEQNFTTTDFQQLLDMIVYFNVPVDY